VLDIHIFVIGEISHQAEPLLNTSPGLAWMPGSPKYFIIFKTSLIT
jgi:hypothetical protein